MPKIRIVIVAPDALLTSVTDAIVKAASTGKIGDGKIFVTEVFDAIPIRTNEHGEAAVQGRATTRLVGKRASPSRAGASGAGRQDLTSRSARVRGAWTMRVLFTSLRNTSHFLPLVPFIEACLGRGHELAVAAPSDLAERIAKTGAQFFPFDHPGDAGLAPFWTRLPTASPEEAKQIVIGGIFAGVCASTALPELRRTVETFRPSLIVRESQEYAAIIAAELAGIPHARVAIMLQHPEMGMYAVAAAAMDSHRKKVGLRLDPGGEALLGEAVLTLMPASLEYPESSGAHVRRFRAARRAPSPLPDWWGEDSRPLLYVTLGTVAGGMNDWQIAYRTVADAVSALPVRVLFTIGNEFSAEAFGKMSANVRVERFVPQEDVLPHARAALCHGGSGSVLGALAAGVPMVVTPMFADQPDNAARVAGSGAGLALDGRALSVHGVREGVSRVLEEDSFRAAARRFASEIAALPAIAAAAVEIERIAVGGSARPGGTST